MMESSDWRLLRRALAVALLGSFMATSSWAQMNMGDMSKGSMSGPMAKDTAKEMAKGGASDGSGPSFRAGDIVVQTPWTRATPGGAKIGVGYMIIKNVGTATDHLVSISTNAAGKSQLHEMAMNNGVMTMRPLSAPLEIAPGASVELKPSGNHVMFEDLKQPLKAGGEVKATLQFEKAGPLDVTFAVGPIGATRPPSALPH